MKMNQIPPMNCPTKKLKTPYTMRMIAKTLPTRLAMRVAFCTFPVFFQMAARRIRPPSSGKPGTMLNTRTMRLMTAEVLHEDEYEPVPGDELREPEEERGEHDRHRGTGRRHLELENRIVDVALHLRHAAEEEERDLAYGQTVSRRDDRVAELVEQYRDEQQDRREESENPQLLLAPVREGRPRTSPSRRTTS